MNFLRLCLKNCYLNVTADRMHPEKKQFFFFIIIYTDFVFSRRLSSAFRCYLVTILLTFTNKYNETRENAVVIS